MFRTMLLGSALMLVPTAAAAAQPTDGPSLSGTRLDVLAVGEVKRVPDIVRINAGLSTQAPTASAAMAQNAQRMRSVMAALKQAGIADRDIQTSSITLRPDYRHSENRSPQLVGYRAGNEVSVRFRDIGGTGKIIDALVAQGANQINGPMLGIDKPEEALNEARAEALRIARTRAELYAREMGKRVSRIVSVSETGGQLRPYPRPMMAEARAMDVAATSIEPGEQTVSATLSVSFELE